MTATRPRLAVVGYAFRFPGPDRDGFWQALCEGRNLVSTVDAFRWSPEAFYHPRESEPGTSYTRAAGTLGDVSGFDAAFFGISPREAAQMDPQQRLLLELTWEALESGGVRPSTLRGSRCGVLVGFSGSDYGYRGAEDIAAIDAFSMTGINGSIAANRISYTFDLRGPSMAVDTACSSSLVAFHQACQSILSRDADMAIVGAVNLHLHPLAYVAFSKASMLSRQGACRAFDAAADGYVRSEGGAIVVLKPLDRAIADGNRVYAVVAGSGLNCDGRTNGLTVPSAEAQAALLTDVYARAGIEPAQIDYLETHGTGTAVGDPIEARALGEALGRRRPAGSPLRIGSVKSNLGHLETAAGMAGLVKALLCLQHRSLPRSLNFDTPNPRIQFADWNLQVVTEQTALDPHRRAVIGVNSFGFGGANAHVILESYQEPPAARVREPRAADDDALPFVVSARSAAALRASALRLADWIGKRSDLPLYDIAYSGAVHRDWHSHRAIAYAHDRESAVRALATFGRDGSAPTVAAGRALTQPRGPVFLYSGNGSQWAGMGGRLLAESTVFRKAIAEVDSWVRQYADTSVTDLLARPAAEQRLETTEFAQPALFALQVGITRMLEAWGVRPRAVAGHSVGEIAAAWASGALPLKTAAYLVCERSAWQGTTRGSGGMVAVALGAQELEPLLRSLEAPPVVAAINSPVSTTVSGRLDQIEQLEILLHARGVGFRRLALDYAFHSPAMDAIHGGLKVALRRIVPGATRVPYYSTVTGDRVQGEALDADYWWRNIREPVRFGPAVASLIRSGESIFVEIGPQPVLRGYTGECLRAASAEGRFVATMSRAGDGVQHLRAGVFDMLIAGGDTGLSAFFPRPGRAVDLPSYPWQRERHWLAPSGEGRDQIHRRQAHPLLGYRVDREGNEWECQLDTWRVPAYADHRIGGEIVLPAAAYVEMAFAAAGELDPATLREIEDLEIRAPIVLSDQRSQTVRFALNPLDGSFTIKSRERLSDHVWRVNVTGRLAAQGAHPAPGPAPQGICPAELSRTQAPIAAEAHYRRASEVGLEYGPAFRAVAEAWRDEANPGAGVGALLATPAVLGESAAQAYLHPSFLDAAFQLLLHAVDGDLSRGMAFVPVRIGRATLLRPHAEARYACARVTWRGTRTLLAQCALYGEDRQPLAILRDVRFRAAPLRQPAFAGLSSMSVRAVPSPLSLAHRRAVLPATDELVPVCAARLHATARQEARWRYFNDVEPLLEALLAAFAAAARAGLLSGSESATAPQLRRLEQLAGDSALPDPAALWTQMLREYPDHANELLWIGRLGSRLSDIVQGRIAGEHFLPPPGGVEADAWSAPWMPETADYAQAIADMANVALASLPHGRRLRVLVLNAEHASPVARLLSRLDPDRCDLETAADSATGDGPYDLVVVEDGLASAHDRGRALGELRGRTAEGGLLVLLERHPSHAVLLAMDFLAPGAKARPRVRPLAPSIWRAELAQQGFQQSMVVEDVPGVEASSYLLIARAVAGPAAAPGAAGRSAGRRWLLVADPSGLSARLGAKLAAELRGRGQSVELAPSDPLNAEKWTALLAQSDDRPHGFDAIVHLAGLADPGRATGRMLRRQAGRCESLAGLLSACAAAGVEKPECWAVSARAAVALLPAPVRKALGLAASADDASYWGFTRTAINEFRELQLRAVDLAEPEHAGTPSDLADALLQADAEDEIILTSAGRYAVRMEMTPFVRRAPAPAPQSGLLRLETPAPGQLKNLRWTRRAAPAPREGEVAIDVRAAGLNFRDVMHAMGQLPDEAMESGFTGATLGMEISGVVRALGAGVGGLAPGDEVIAFTTSGFATQAVTLASAVLPKPASWSFEAAATVQTAFFTAYYALHHLGRLQRGERVLIHGGAGGVGLAAIQVAQMKGAEVHATAGTDAKRDLLRLLGVKHVYDSRSLAFADEILACTGGEGVDLVLNSLAGEAMHRSLQVLRPMGRFLELGKRDFYDNTRVGLRPLRNNISYFAVDADQLMKERPDFTRGLMMELLGLFESGALNPLPYRAFRPQEAVDAFRFMQQSRHIGKIVLSFDTPPEAEAETEAEDGASPSRLLLPADATYLVTGGLRGFGLRTAQWLAERGARHLVLAARTEPREPESLQALAALAAQGVQVKVAQCDVIDARALRALLARLRDSMPPLRGVVHASAVFQDSLIRNLDRESIEAVLAPKVLGAANLHRLTRHLKLDFFVLYSSATTMFGNPGQANYVAANCYLEALAEVRRESGLPALCVGWGAIEDAGYLARNPGIRAHLAERVGGASMRAALALDALEQLLLHDVSGTAVLKFDRAGLARFLGNVRSPKYARLAAHTESTAREMHSAADLRLWVEQTGDAEALPALTDLLRREIADILRTDVAKLETDAPLQELGLDSLMAVELMTAIEARFGTSLPAMALAEAGTLERLALRILRELKHGGARAEEPQAELAGQVRQLAAQHAREIDPGVIEEIAADMRITAK